MLEVRTRTHWRPFFSRLDGLVLLSVTWVSGCACGEITAPGGSELRPGTRGRGPGVLMSRDCLTFGIWSGSCCTQAEGAGGQRMISRRRRKLLLPSQRAG
ncbi:hypothetical protein R3P38DRAFT_2901816 [Favolaschia claudopus]|uniref:Secreted protein n=1 Tax=Favolaschia claudopus TaxID=2862362 RepID=A0AAW0CLS0_9AGAR